MKSEDIIEYVSSFRYYFIKNLLNRGYSPKDKNGIITSFYPIKNGGFVFIFDSRVNFLSGDNINQYEVSLENILVDHYLLEEIETDKLKQNNICLTTKGIVVIKINCLDLFTMEKWAELDAKTSVNELVKMLVKQQELSEESKIGNLEKENQKLKEEIQNIKKVENEEKFMDSKKPFSKIKSNIFSFMKMIGKFYGK